MMLRFQILLILLISLSARFCCAQDNCTPVQIYDAISKKEINVIDDQLKCLKLGKGKNQKAYTGTLEMRKAGLLKGPSEKLKMFKSGNHKLEEAIKLDPDNVEYRFLRLIIQEQSPAILGYKSDLEKDKEYLRTHYRKLSPTIIQAIINYCKGSKILNAADFQAS